MKISGFKRVLAGVSAAAMAFSLISYVPLDWGTESPYVIEASALEAPEGYITDSNGLMAYTILNGSSNSGSSVENSSVNLRGVFNNDWKMVCYRDKGFRSVLRIGEKCYYPDLKTGSSVLPTQEGNSLISEDCGLGVKFNPKFVSDGKLLQMVYEVTNTSDASISFDFGFGSDVQIGGCDSAPISKLDKTKDGQETGFLMESTYASDSMTDESGNTVFAGFGLIMNGAKGANASDFWYGGFSAVYSDDNIFNSTVPENPYSGDSGAIVSWKDRTVAPGETVSLSCYVGIGSAEELKALIKEMLSATTDYKNEQLTDLEPDSLYELTITESDGTQTTHPITSTPEGTIPMTGTDDNGDPYSMIGKTSSLIKKGDGEDTEDSDPITIEVADRPETPEDPNVPSGTVDDILNPSDVETTENSITFPSKPNTEYTIDGGNTWVTPDENGNIVFDDLTEGEEYTIQSRTPATDSSPASPISEGVKIVVQNMVTEDEIDISADDLVFTGEPQSIEVKCDDPDITITYSTSLDEEFTSEVPVFTDDGVYTVYYCAQKPGCYPKYGFYTVTIVKYYDFDSNEHWKIIDGVKTMVGAHTFGDWKTVTESGCTTEGKKKHICTVCGYYEFEPIDALGHVLEKIDRVEPTCTENGKEEFYTCTVCDMLFADSEGKSEITEEELIIPAAGHTEVIDPAVPATCTETGLTEGSHCSVCDDVIVAQEVVPALGHNFEDGECTVCGEPDPGFVPEADEGDIIVDNEDNVGGAGVDGEELKNAVEITPEEQALIEAGEDLHIILNVQNADSTVSAEDKALIESALSENMTVGMFLDIVLVKKIGELETAIHETNAPVTITFEMPEDLINKDENVARKYFIIRVHEGAVDILECTFDPATGKASFMTDRFSSYAIAYRDTVTVEPEPEPEPEKVVYYPVITSGDVVADKSYAAAGQTVNVIAGFGYDIIVTAANGRQVAKMTEKGSFTMPASAVYVKAVQNETIALISNAWRHSYVFSYDAEMNIIKVNSDVKRGVIVIDLGAEYAGRDFTVYAGRKSTKTEIISGTLDKYGRFTFKADEGMKYTLVVE
ncbi:MAG: hypothetical protein ACI4J0_02800 [Huintestinicola sp.]|uniref:hypothetical protein n=1 Tax=Huintestinicola sp. TaxID=2981661 RepID=UPI003F017C35